MSNPLFTAEEDAEYKTKKDAIEAEWLVIREKYWTNKTSYPQEDFEKNSRKRKALDDARLIQQVRRAQIRAQEFLNALLLSVGSKGTHYIDFDDAFAKSDDPEYVAKLAEVNTPEARRSLHTVLKALTEIPKSWATSAFVRFLRGNGKQKGATYHGAGTFGVQYGWKADEVTTAVHVITGGGPFSKVLMSYADMYDEISEASNEDYTINHNARNFATNADRDTIFLNKLCEMLQIKGLGPIPTPAEKKQPKPHKAKVFESGDIIKKSTIRDLPLPAHIRLTVQKRKNGQGVTEVTEDTIEEVVTQLHNGGYYTCAFVKPGTNKAYPVQYHSKWGHKRDLEGATFLGKWTGTIAKEKTMELGFSFWVKH